MKVKEVFPGSDAAPNAQYVVIQMYAAGQNEVGGKQIRVYDGKGVLTSTFMFPASVPGSADQSTILIATPEALAFFAPLTADLQMTAVLPRLAGKVCFFDPDFGLNEIDCVAWGGFAGSGTGVGTPFNSPVGLVRGAAVRRRLDICGQPTVLDACDDTENSANDFRSVAPAPRNNAGQTGTTPPSVCGNNQLQSLEQCDDGNLVTGDGCGATCLRETNAATAQALVVDPPTLDQGIFDVPLAEGNGVFEPGEEVAVLPSWRNAATAPLSLTGTVSVVSGPPGATYNATDPNSMYGTVAPGATVPCQGCLVVTVSNPPTRPVTHWDAFMAEVMSTDGFKTWFLHLGNSFTDVPETNPFYRFVETLLHRGITAGCTNTTYCPSAATTREGMAVFVLVAKEGAGYNPPACGTPIFNDVPAASPFCRWIEELARRGVVGGCGQNLYCPSSPVTREAMSVFVLRTLDPALDPPACGTPVFNDVPATSAFCRWIEELARRGVVAGCAPNLYCPSSPVSREQMGVFLGVTFGLTLYGV
jgi:cysteine-rich repeat protein